MAEEFQGGVCGGNWWNSPGNLFRSSPCSSAINGPGSFGWFNHDPAIDMKIASRSISDDSAGSASDGTGSIVLQKPSHDTIQMMGISFSSTDDWNQNLLHDSGKSEQNYPQMLQLADEGFNSSMNNYGQNNTDDFSDSINFPLSSDSYSYTSSLLQNLFDDTDSDQPQQSTNYLSSPNNYQMNSTDFLPKQQPAANNHLQFTNNTPFWNATSASFVPSTQTQLLPSSLSNAKPNLHSFSAKRRNEESGGLNSVAPKKVLNESVIKRPRIETPSPLPTFKVRKEKLGDRVTALQQLVSPFGKTDTASVLHEAIEYIKFLHDQVSVLSTPYLKNGSPQLQRQQPADKNKDDQAMQDLRSRGLCLVPISSTFPVTAENTTHDFWTPSFGGCFR
ncbi:hypothetical protein DH2020_032978 [Rehmannia glutinosa]|uniref:BHLH domain-containing protein n=1 Tax=Rehmannia glutinosa TaxID=99300 RepID=A0ABR0VHM7_REHGL